MPKIDFSALAKIGRFLRLLPEAAAQKAFPASLAAIFLGIGLGFLLSWPVLNYKKLEIAPAEVPGFDKSKYQKVLQLEQELAEKRAEILRQAPRDIFSP